MAHTSLKTKAIDVINKQGILLVYPIDNRSEPFSIWSELYPKTKMRWEWDEQGDSRVASLWQLREELSRSREVVYSKWYQNRATFFSLPVFQALYSLTRQQKPQKWRSECDEILEILEMDSPLSTKQIKLAVNLQGKLLEPIYDRSMKPLWQHFDIVGFGEIQDSSFPSLAVGAAKTLFEDLISDCEKNPPKKSRQIFEAHLPEHSLWRKFWNRSYPGS